jgi:hypothetical protein
MGTDVFVIPKDFDSAIWLASRESSIIAELTWEENYHEKYGEFHIITQSMRSLKRERRDFNRKMKPKDLLFGVVQVFGGEDRRQKARQITKLLKSIISRYNYNPEKFVIYTSW